MSESKYLDLFGRKTKKKKGKPGERKYNTIEEIGYYEGGFFAIVDPLSVNEAWKGKRFKSNSYKSYTKAFKNLRKFSLPKKEAYQQWKVSFVFGVSNAQKDWDNGIKPLQDIVCKKIGVNDAHIAWGEAVKITGIREGREFVGVLFEPVNPSDISKYLSKFKTVGLL